MAEKEAVKTVENRAMSLAQQLNEVKQQLRTEQRSARSDAAAASASLRQEITTLKQEIASAQSRIVELSETKARLESENGYLQREIKEIPKRPVSMEDFLRLWKTLKDSGFMSMMSSMSMPAQPAQFSMPRDLENPMPEHNPFSYPGMQ